ncbi:hypothetical protein ACF0H5_002821 [Mactra antiquata]
MKNLLTPRAAGKFIAEKSKDVFILDEGIKSVAEVMATCLKSGRYSIKSWKQHDLNPKKMDKAALDWIFVADTLNFSFWSADDTEKYVVKYGGKDYTGYWSLCAAMNRAIDEGIPVTDPQYYANITKDQLAHIFRSDSDYEIPMFAQRLEVLQDAGQVLLQQFNGNFANVIEQCNKSAQSLIKIVVEHFKSYRDETKYEDEDVAIYKRVQILVADIWACFEGEGYGEFNDIETITMFADYRIPQALVYFGALKYSDDLMEFLKQDKMMTSGERLEVEIRGCSIWATELIAEETRKLLSDTNITVNSILIDHYLWDYRREFADKMTDIPFHKIRCIYY